MQSTWLRILGGYDVWNCLQSATSVLYFEHNHRPLVGGVGTCNGAICCNPGHASCRPDLAWFGPSWLSVLYVLVVGVTCSRLMFVQRACALDFALPSVSLAFLLLVESEQFG